MAILATIEPPSNRETGKTKENAFGSKIKNRLNKIIIPLLAFTRRFGGRLVKVFLLKSILSVLQKEDAGKTKETGNLAPEDDSLLREARGVRLPHFASGSGGQAKKGIIPSIMYYQFLPHAALSLLSLVVISSNIVDKQINKQITSSFIYADPISEISIAESVDYFTPLIKDDSVQLQKGMEFLGTSDGFASAINPVATIITSREQPKPALPDNSGEAVDYVVQNGDTLTGLGWQFEVKLATLKYVNNIDNINALKPDTKLKIPQKGYEVSAAMIAKRDRENEAKKSKLAASKRTTITRSTSVARAANDDYDSDSLNLILPINHNGVSRGLGNGHTGIDYRANINTPVKAAASGVISIVSTGWSGGYGNQIVINHGNGVFTRYAHLNSVDVSPGDRVEQGHAIGKSGNSGRSTGPHLHFEKIVNGRPVNPF